MLIIKTERIIMHQTVNKVRRYFKTQLSREKFTISRNGDKTIELLGASFIADEPSIFGKPNMTYIKAEIDWYNKQSLNINDIYDDPELEPPKQWQLSANEWGNINSNYGYLAYSDDNGEQFS